MKQQTKPELLPLLWPLVALAMVQKWWGKLLLSSLVLLGSAFDVILWMHERWALALGTLLCLCALLSPLAVLRITRKDLQKDMMKLLTQTFLLAMLSLALFGLGFLIIIFRLLVH